MAHDVPLFKRKVLPMPFSRKPLLRGAAVATATVLIAGLLASIAYVVLQ